jgi:hypothetical protein
MNLIQIQEHLKDLPTQAIMAYANGQNPEVPPYMALGEMNRRKNMEQRAAQAPSGSVKDKLESELAQQTALPGIGQGMNMRINPEGMPQPVPAAQPQMAPQMPKMQNPPMARPTPPQQMAQPGSIPAGAPGMAGGGLAGLPVHPHMFNYAPGGIVAFANPDNEQLVPNPIAVSDEAVASGGAAPDDQGLPTALANTILRQRLMGNAGIPMPEDPEEIRKKYIAAHPEQAKLLNALPGEALTKLAGELESQNKAQRERFQQGEGTRGLAALSQALIAAGEATRGQKGMGLGSAFGGFGKSFNQSTLDAEDRAAKQQAAERAQTIETIKLQSDIEGLQRAYAEGNIAKIAEYKKAIQARQEKIATIQGTASKEVLDLEDKLKQREAQEARYKATAAHEDRMYKQSVRANELAASSKPTAEEKNILSVMNRLNNDPDYKSLLKKRENFNPGDPEFESIQDVLDSMRDAAFTDLKLNPPTKRDRLQAPVIPAKPGFFQSMMMSAEDKQALDWANAHPKDPRSAQIKQKLGL